MDPRAGAQNTVQQNADGSIMLFSL